jgi:hypothetical protein
MFKNQSMAYAAGQALDVSVAQGRRHAGLSSPLVLRCALVGGAICAVGLAAGFGDPIAHLRADPDLSHLLRGMAVIKAALAVLAIAVLSWRFARPIPPATAVAYVIGAWLMAAASMIVWRLSFIGVGALAFHTGELTLLIVAWREHRRESFVRDPVTATA